MKAYPAILKKVGTDDVYVGSFYWYPRAGTSFVFNIAYMKSSDRNELKTLRTSTIGWTRFADGKITFATLNSTYELVETPAITDVTYFPKRIAAISPSEDAFEQMDIVEDV